MTAKDKSTVLVVDDEEDLRDAISFDLQRKGFNVLTAASGNEAFEMIKQHKIDVVLSDVRMPNGDGVELLEKIKAINVFLPVVIFITGFADISLEEAYEKGVDAVFSKPFDRMLLLEAVTRAAQPLDAKFQRGSGRVDVELPIGIHFSGSAQTIDCVARNIGRGGMFVPLSESLPKLESCTFSIKAEQLGNIKIKGEGIVRWTRSSSPSSSLPVGAGIEFLSFEPESKRAVIDLINFLKTKSFIPRK